MACDVRVLAVGPGCGGRGVGRHALPTPRCHAAAPSSTTGSVSMMFCSRIATSRPAGAVPSPLCAWRPPRAEWGAWKCDCRTISTASLCAAPAFQISAGSVTSGVWLPAWILTRARFRSKRWPTERISSVRGRRHLGVPGETKALPGGRAPSKRCAMRFPTNVPPEAAERIRDAFCNSDGDPALARQHSAQRRRAQGH